MNMEITAESEYATSDTLLNATYDFEFDVQTTFNAIFFFCVLRGTQRTLTGVQPLVPSYWPGY